MCRALFASVVLACALPACAREADDPARVALERDREGDLAPLEFPRAAVRAPLPPGYRALVAGDYALARPIGEDADVERMLFLSHRRATLEDLRTLFGGMAGDGPGAFVELDPVPSRCFDGAWAQRADGDEWGKVVVFRSNGKLEVRIESARGRARILALLEGIGCEGDAP